MLEQHARPWEIWQSALASGRLHHGWILAGRKGLGKATFAYSAAAEIVGASRAADLRQHPDILTLEPLPDGEEEERKRSEGKPFKLKRSIAIDQVRAMQRRLNTRPTLGDRRAVIIDSADDLERGAFNALLKSLEEPPGGCVFLLISHRPGALPPTIRSRCRVLRFNELEDDAISRMLILTYPEMSHAAKLSATAFAQGSPGAALDFARRNLATAYALLERLARDGDADFALRGALLGEIGARPDRETQVVLIEAARTVVSRRAAEGSAGVGTIDAHVALSRLLTQAPTANFDPATLILEIGGLLASAAADRKAA